MTPCLPATDRMDPHATATDEPEAYSPTRQAPNLIYPSCNRCDAQLNEQNASTCFFCGQQQPFCGCFPPFCTTCRQNFLPARMRCSCGELADPIPCGCGCPCNIYCLCTSPPAQCVDCRKEEGPTPDARLSMCPTCRAPFSLQLDYPCDLCLHQCLHCPCTDELQCRSCASNCTHCRLRMAHPHPNTTADLGPPQRSTTALMD